MATTQHQRIILGLKVRQFRQERGWNFEELSKQTGISISYLNEIEKGKKWKVLMHCTDGPDEGPESDIFERLPDGKLKVTVMDNATIFQRCDTDKGN